MLSERGDRGSSGKVNLWPYMATDKKMSLDSLLVQLPLDLLDGEDDGGGLVKGLALALRGREQRAVRGQTVQTLALGPQLLLSGQLQALLWKGQ